MDPELWDQLVAAARALAAALWHDEVIAVSFLLRHQGRATLPLPLLPAPPPEDVRSRDRTPNRTPGADTPDLTARQRQRELTGTEELIVQVLGRSERPLKGRAVATRAGVSYSPHFRSLLAGQVAEERIAKDPAGGYRLPGQR